MDKGKCLFKFNRYALTNKLNGAMKINYACMIRHSQN